MSRVASSLQVTLSLRNEKEPRSGKRESNGTRERQNATHQQSRVRNVSTTHACSRGPGQKEKRMYRTERPRQSPCFFSFPAKHPPTKGLGNWLGSSGPRAQKHAFSTSAPAELHVRAARREKGARRALGRFEPVGSLASLWGVRNRYPELNFCSVASQLPINAPRHVVGAASGALPTGVLHRASKVSRATPPI